MNKKELIKTIWRLYNAGWTTGEIAGQLHVSESFVVAVINKG